MIYQIHSNNHIPRVPSPKDALHRPSSQQVLRARRWSLSFSATHSRQKILFKFICLVILLFLKTGYGAQQEILILGEEIAPSHRSSFINVLPIRQENRSKTVIDFLKSQKGIIVKSQSASGSVATVNIRGLADKAEQVLVLLDGIRLNKAQGTGVDLSRIPLAIVEKIEIIRGGESALYGSDAIGGVINIVTLKNKPELSYSFSKNTLDPDHISDHTFSMNMGKRLGSLDTFWDTFFSFHSEKNKGDYAYLNPITQQKEKRTHNQFVSKGFLIKSSALLSASSSLSFLQETTWASQEVPGSLAFLSQGIQKDIRSLSALDLTLALPKERHFTARFPFRWDVLTYIDSFWMARHTNIHLEPTLSFSSPVGRNHLGTLLLQTNIDTFKSTSIDPHPLQIKTAWVLKDDFYVNSFLALTPVIRIEHFPHAVITTPKLGLTYQALSNFYIKSNLSRNFRAPSLSELYWQDSYYSGNPNLKPETSWDGDVGFSSVFSSWKLEHSLFTSHIKNLISSQIQSNGRYVAENVDKSSVFGTETSLESELPFIFHVYGSTNYTWLNKALPRRPKHLLNSQLKWQNNAFTIFADHQYVSRILTQDPSRPELLAFHLFGAGASYEFFKAVTVTAEVNNLFNQAYERIAYYPMPGRSFGLSVSGAL